MPLNFDAMYQAEFNEHDLVLQATKHTMFKPLQQLLNHCATAVTAGNKILFFGNGGSAADAQHLATELCVRYRNDRVPIPAIALTTDSSVLTAIGNDLGFDYLFARQIEALGKPGDVAIAISTSGRSVNVIKGLEAARAQGLRATAMSGGNGGALPDIADPLLIVPSGTTARIQEMHILIGQILCGALELELKLTSN